MARIIKANAMQPTDGSPSPVMSLADLASEARAILLDARKDAARIVAEARARAEATADEAVEKGYAEGLARGQNDGYEDGHRRGLTEAAQQLGERARGVLELADRVVCELSDSRAELLHQGRCELLDFALELAEKIVGRVAACGPEAARENLRKALELADCAQELQVKVNPSQLDDLHACLPQLTESLGRTGEVRLVGDETISPGGVKLFSRQGEIDATIRTQLCNVVEALLGPGAASEGGGRYRPVARVAAEPGKQPLVLAEDPAGGSDPAPAVGEETTETLQE